MSWGDAFNDQGDFEPNAILKAQAYVRKYTSNPDPSNQPTAAFLDNILSQNPSESVFLSQVKPSFLTDFAGHTNKGVFGLRVDCGHGIEIKNCRIGNIENTGEKGTILTDIPAGEEYSELEQIRYTGNDVHGLSLVSCHNCSVRDAWVFECSSSNGHIFGVNLDSHAGVNYFEGCVSSAHRAELDNVGSIVNPSSQVYGYFIEDGSHDQIFVECTSCSLESPRAACGFFIKEAARILCERCVSTGHTATSLSNLDQGKFALGFKSIASHCSRFIECRSIGTKCSGEVEYSEQSASVAAGFICEENEELDIILGKG